MSRENKIGAIVSLILLAGGAYFAIFGFRTTRMESLQQVVQRNITTGEAPQEVIDFLRGQSLDPSGLIKPEVVHIGGHDYGGQNIVVAVKRYSARALLWKEMIYLVFVFDGDGKLVRYDLFPVYDSL
jgi:hypothetical protein